MPDKENCWEFFKCGREIGGTNVAGLGVCPASTDVSADRLNCGKNGGRICWSVTGTFCDGKVQGTFAQKELSCVNCDFYKKVRKEENQQKFALIKPGQSSKKTSRLLR